jgi:hypothetical protein
MTDISTGKSWGGTIGSIVMLKVSQLIQSDIMFLLGVISAVITIGYTIHKWILLVKNHKK